MKDLDAELTPPPCQRRAACVKSQPSTYVPGAGTSSGWSLARRAPWARATCAAGAGLEPLDPVVPPAPWLGGRRRSPTPRQTCECRSLRGSSSSCPSGLPDGFTSAWMWPCELSTNSARPPSRLIVSKHAFHGVMWSVTAPTTKLSHTTSPRSTGVSRATSSPGCVIELVVAMVEEIVVQFGREVGVVDVPGEHVEGWRVLAQEVVVDPVVPDQVVRSQPGEHLRQLTPSSMPFDWLDRRAASSTGPDMRVPNGRWHRPVEDRDEKARRVDAAVADRSEVPHQRGARHAAGAHAEQIEVVRTGDLERGVARLEQRREVGVEVPIALFGARIAPADEEHLMARLHEVFDEAAAWREIEHVVAVDLRRHDEDRTCADVLGRRCVLDEFEHRVAEHDGPGRCGDGLAGDERPAVDHRRQGTVRSNVVQRVAGTVDEAAAPCAGGLSDRCRVGEEVVGRSDRARDDRSDQFRAQPALVVHVEIVDEAADLAFEGDMVLGDPSEQWAPFEGLVAESAVLRIRADVADAGRDLDVFGGERNRSASDRRAAGSTPCARADCAAATTWEPVRPIGRAEVIASIVASTISTSSAVSPTLVSGTVVIDIDRPRAIGRCNLENLTRLPKFGYYRQ